MGPKFNQRFNNWHGTIYGISKKKLKFIFPTGFTLYTITLIFFPNFAAIIPFILTLYLIARPTYYLTLHPLINYLKFKRKFVKSINKRLDRLPNTIRDLSLLMYVS